MQSGQNAIDTSPDRPNARCQMTQPSMKPYIAEHQSGCGLHRPYLFFSLPPSPPAHLRHLAKQSLVPVLHTRAELDELGVRLRRELEYARARGRGGGGGGRWADAVARGEDAEDVARGDARLGDRRAQEDTGAERRVRVHVEPRVARGVCACGWCGGSATPREKKPGVGGAPCTSVTRRCTSATATQPCSIRGMGCIGCGRGGAGRAEVVRCAGERWVPPRARAALYPAPPTLSLDMVLMALRGLGPGVDAYSPRRAWRTGTTSAWTKRRQSARPHAPLEFFREGPRCLRWEQKRRGHKQTAAFGRARASPNMAGVQGWCTFVCRGARGNAGTSPGGPSCCVLCLPGYMFLASESTTLAVR